LGQWALKVGGGAMKVEEKMIENYYASYPLRIFKCLSSSIGTHYWNITFIISVPRGAT
jgi:hypothetical protein